CMFSANPGDRYVGDFVGPRIAQHAYISCPGRRLADKNSGVMIVMRVGDQDSVGGEPAREVVAEPDATGEGIDEEARACCGMNAKARMSDVFDRDLSPL